MGRGARVDPELAGEVKFFVLEREAFGQLLVDLDAELALLGFGEFSELSEGLALLQDLIIPVFDLVALPPLENLSNCAPFFPQLDDLADDAKVLGEVKLLLGDIRSHAIREMFFELLRGGKYRFGIVNIVAQSYLVPV